MSTHTPSLAYTAATTAGAAARPVNADSVPMVLDSEALFAGQQTVLIRHQGEVYRLQKTRQGKLILTK